MSYAALEIYNDSAIYSQKPSAFPLIFKGTNMIVEHCNAKLKNLCISIYMGEMLFTGNASLVWGELCMWNSHQLREANVTEDLTLKNLFKMEFWL